MSDIVKMTVEEILQKYWEHDFSFTESVEAFEALIKEQVIAELNNVLLVGRLVQDEYEALKATEAYVENRIKELKK